MTEDDRIVFRHSRISIRFDLFLFFFLTGGSVWLYLCRDYDEHDFSLLSLQRFDCAAIRNGPLKRLDVPSERVSRTCPLMMHDGSLSPLLPGDDAREISPFVSSDSLSDRGGIPPGLLARRL